MVTTLRLAFKQQRFEAVTVLVAGWTAAAAGLVLAWLVDDAQSGGMLARYSADLATWADRWLTVMPVLPYAAGLLLGVPLVSRELEHGTATLAWTIGPSRQRWLAGRTLAMVVILALALVPVAVVGDHLEWVRFGIDPGASFAAFGARGGILVVRGLAALAVGTAVGLIVGRQVPTLVVAAIALACLVGGAAWVMDRWYASRIVAVPLDAMQPGDHEVAEALFRAADGTLFDGEQVSALQPPNPARAPGEIDESWLERTFTMVQPIVPADDYAAAEVVEGGVTIGAALVLGGLALVVVPRRRVT